MMLDRPSVALFQLIRERRIGSYGALLNVLSSLGPEYASLRRFAVDNRSCLVAYFRSKRFSGRFGQSPG